MRDPAASRNRPKAVVALATLALLLCALGPLACSEDAAKPADAGVDVVADVDGSGGADGADGGGDAPKGDPAAQAALLAVPEAETFVVSGLKGPVHIVETEAGVPHLYAFDAVDLAFGHGFVVGRDRWFVVDMGRRLGQGRVSELLGEAALDSDLDARQTAMTFVSQQLLAALTPQQQARFDAFAAGLNAYRDAVAAGTLPPPSELKLAAPLLGGKKPIELMAPFTRADVAGFAAVIIYQLGFETGDVGRGHTALTLNSLFAGVAEADLRRAGAIGDIWRGLAPVKKVSAAPGFGLNPGGPLPPGKGAGAGQGLPDGRDPGRGAHRRAAGAASAAFAASGSAQAAESALAQLTGQLAARLDAFEQRFGRDVDAGFGSNAWAVAAGGTKDGRALLAGDGHLPLTIPSLFYQIGFDTAVFGGGDTHQLGLVIPGLPLLAVGTNGKVAWCQTQIDGDITDWYVEELILGADGLPVSSRFQGKEQPLKATVETIQIAEIKSPVFPSKGGSRTFTRWTTFDGRWLQTIEGVVVGKASQPAPSAKAVLVGSEWREAKDTDGDGKISAISFDYTGLDKGNLLLAVDGFGHAEDIAGYREATRSLVAYSQNLIAADASGDVYYSGYQAVPCRSQLPKGKDGRWEAGGDPSGLLDGTKFGGFTIPIDSQGRVDEAPGASDPSQCVVPFAGYPAASYSGKGIVVTANNDPGGASFDGIVENDAHYLGGPWDVGFRAARIVERLESQASAGEATMASMAEVQADIKSANGCHFGPFLRGAIAKAKGLKGKANLAADEARLVALYEALTPTVDDVDARLGAWIGAGCRAASGVETFYNPKVDAAQKADAVATTLFNRWWGRAGTLIFDDEPMPGIWRYSGSHARARALDALLNGRGPGNPRGLQGYNPATGESIFFDRVGTDIIERSDEVLLMALQDALSVLKAAPKGPGSGGFGSADLSTWLYGLRHGVRFVSTIADFFDGDGLSSITDQFAIQTDKLPLLTGDPKAPGKLEAGDPRKGLIWFPRGGDAFAVDAAGGSWNGDDANYGSGPVFRMVIALGADGAEVHNVLPGGQSGLNDSKHFADQARYWLANQSLVVPFRAADVAKAAVRRVSLRPAAP